MAKTNEEIAAEVRMGGNLPGGYVFNVKETPMVRKKTAAEEREDTEAEKAAAKLENKIEAAQPVSGGVNVNP